MAFHYYYYAQAENNRVIVKLHYRPSLVYLHNVDSDAGYYLITF
jgi:hypothetical protein